MSLHQPETLTNIMPAMPKEEEVSTSEPQQKMPKVNTDRPWYTDYGISHNGEDRYEAMVKFINECAEWAHVEDENLRKELKLYTYQVNMYGPYEVDVFPDWPLFSKVHPIDFEGDKEFVEVVKTGTKSAIALYNREHSLDENISLVKIVKVNLICGYGRRFYITFDADVSMSGLRKTYQAEVLKIGDYIDAMMCHIKPDYKKPNPPIGLDNCPALQLGIIRPVPSEEKELFEIVEACTDKAIAFYNEQHNQSDEDIIFEKILNAQYKIDHGKTFYIAFDAVGSKSGLRKTYQAEVIYRIYYTKVVTCQLDPESDDELCQIEEEITVGSEKGGAITIDCEESRPCYFAYGYIIESERSKLSLHECAEWAHVEDKNLRKELKLYTYQLHTYGPYEVDVFPDWPLLSKVHPVDFDGDVEFVGVVKTGTESAIALYNREHSSDENIILAKIVKANLINGYGRRFYITFDADNCVSGLRKTYQAEVLNLGDSIDAVMCHLKPDYKKPNPPIGLDNCPALVLGKTFPVSLEDKELFEILKNCTHEAIAFYNMQHPRDEDIIFKKIWYAECKIYLGTTFYIAFDAVGSKSESRKTYIAEVIYKIYCTKVVACELTQLASPSNDEPCQMIEV